MNTATATTPSAPSAAEVELRRSVINVDDVAIRCLEAGTGSPVVYLHGSEGLRLSITHRAIAQSHRLIALELPGFGWTPARTAHDGARASNHGARTTYDGSRTAYDGARAMAATVARALDSLGIEACAFMGHALGADVALWLAIDRPALATSLILLAPTAIRPVDSGISGKPPLTVPAPNPAHLWFSEPDANGEPAHAQQAAPPSGGPARDAEFEKAMAGIAVPVLALFGTRSTVVSTDAARLYSTLLPKCFTTMVYDAGHDIDLDRPDAVTAVVKNFLQHGETFIVNRDNAIINP